MEDRWHKYLDGMEDTLTHLENQIRESPEELEEERGNIEAMGKTLDDLAQKFPNSLRMKVRLKTLWKRLDNYGLGRSFET